MSNVIDSIQLSGVTYGIKGSGGTETIELTQAQYDALVDKDPNVFYIITDAQAGDLTNYYTKTEVDNAITAATSTKQDTLVSSQNIKTINNESLLGSGNIDIQGGGGGGKAVSAGTNISVTTGETADTINCTLPIISFSNKALKFGYYASSYTADTIGEAAIVGGGIGNTHNIATSTGSISLGASSSATSISSVAFGGNNLSSGRASFAMGGMNSYSYQGNNAIGHSSFVGGIKSNARGDYSFAFGNYINANNQSEHSQGEYNVSNTGSTDADKTLFSVGNGTADNARHNAFEIRQNGDIYITSGGTDIKLQDNLGGGGGGGSITIDPSLDSGSTNPVANSAITNAFNSYTAKKDYLNGEVRYFYWSTPSYPFGSTIIANFSINGRCPLTRTNGTNEFIDKFSLVETSAITTSISSSSTDAQVPSAKAVNDKLGGLSLVKLTQAEYDALETKDNSTLYVIVN